MSEESKELDGNVSTAELLGEVKTAIRKILIGGQSYQIGSRKLTRPLPAQEAERGTGGRDSRRGRHQSPGQHIRRLF